MINQTMQILNTIAALFDNLAFVFIVNPNTDEYKFSSYNENLRNAFIESTTFCGNFFTDFIHILENHINSDKAKVLEFFSKTNILNTLQKQKNASIQFHFSLNEIKFQLETKIFKVADNNGDEKIIVGIILVSSEKNKEQEQQKYFKISKAVANNYTDIYYVNISENTIQTYAKNGKLFDQHSVIESEQKFNEFFDTFIKMYVHPEDQDRMVKTIGQLSPLLIHKKSISTFFRRSYDNQFFYTEMNCIKMEEGDDIPNEITLCLSQKESSFNQEKQNSIFNDQKINNLKEIFLKQQKLLSQNQKIIATLASEYNSVFHINISDMKVFPYVVDPSLKKRSKDFPIRNATMDKVFSWFVDTFIYQPDRENILKEGSFNAILKKLEHKKSCEQIFRMNTEAGPEFRKMKFIKADDIDCPPTSITFALSNHDDEIIAQFVNTRILGEYASIYYGDLEKNLIRTVKQSTSMEIGKFPSAPYDKMMYAFAQTISQKYREQWESLSDVKNVYEFLGNEDFRELVYEVPELTRPWRRSEWQVVERKNGRPSIIIVYFRGIDNTTAEKIELDTKIASQKKALETQQGLLEIALAKAESASKAKTNFLANMSHDIRTPMNAIMGFNDLALSHIDNKEKVRNYLTKSSISSNHLLSLINNILDMNRIESGKIQLDKSPCNLRTLVEEINNIIQDQAKTRGIAFSVNMENFTNRNVICDKLRLNQVLLNLIGNSLKFTPSGGFIQLRINQKKSGDNFGAYEFRVKDNGVGMSKEFVEKIFEPFEREYDSTTSGILGTGLGMSITKSIIDLMGGTIEVNTEKGKGTEFIINLTLPLATDLRITDEEAELFPFKETKSLAGKKILLVEDNLMNREIAQDILEEIGLIIEHAENGAVAVEKVKEKRYDIILMDVQMPVMDGYEATRQIKSLGGDIARIPIIAMTANAFVEDQKRAFEAGMSGHIPKPIKIDCIVSTLNQFF